RPPVSANGAPIFTSSAASDGAETPTANQAPATVAARSRANVLFVIVSYSLWVVYGLVAIFAGLFFLFGLDVGQQIDVEHHAVAAIDDLGDVDGDTLVVGDGAMGFRRRRVQRDMKEIGNLGIGGADHQSLVRAYDLDVL